MELDSRQKAFFLMTLKLRPKTADGLFAYVPQDLKNHLNDLYKDLKGHDEASIKSVANAELRKLAKHKSLSYLSEVHDDWIIDLLAKESPQMIATILRYLPAERVKTILESLPKEILDQMPKMADTFNIPPVLVDLLKQKFEDQFAIHKTFNVQQDFEFHHFCLLKASQIQLAFLEIGYQEIALGLKSLPEKTRQVVIQRLSPSDREHVEFYLKKDGKVSDQRIKKAQEHLVSQNIHSKESSLFVKEIGFLVFAKCLTSNDLSDLNIIMKKMSKAEATDLKIIVDKYLTKNTEASVVAYQEDVLVAVRHLLGGKR